jgi:23S rRNA pseudouridine2605 synthase
VGLARVLSKLGYCSRSQAVELIRAGRVRLNGTLRHDPETPVHLGRDRIEVDRQRVEAKHKVYLMMNKPRGLVTTAADEKGRDTVYSILRAEDSLPWLAPVGRLDKASEGLLLLTNDSEWGAKIADPTTHLPKTYHVQLGALPDDGLIQRLKCGVQVEGEFLRAQDVRIIRSGQKNCWLEIELDEGKNRQIRRMLNAYGVEVLRLVRVAIGPLRLGKLAKGTYRLVTREEKLALDEALLRNKN